MARKRDAVDTACEEWAAVRRRIDKGDFAENHDWLGAVRCTIAEKRDLHAGAKSVGRVVQHFPEVHDGVGLVVARAFQRLQLPLREVLYAHYVVRAPVSVKIDRLGVSPRHYWERLGRAKAFVGGWVSAYDAHQSRGCALAD
jgi:hypothetical protein